MNRRAFLGLGPALLLAACVGAGTEPVQLGADGKPLPRIYRITPAIAGQIPYRFLDSVNTMRRAKGAQPLA